jgi:anti-sigma-K factor RskA
MNELAAAYALDALEPDETDAFEQHLSECPRCRAEVQDFRETASLLAHAGADAPEGLWERIASELHDDTGRDAPVLRFPSEPAETPRRRLVNRQLRTGVLAAAAVLALVLGANTVALLRQNDRLDNLNTQQSIANIRQLAFQAQSDPASRLARLTSPTGAVIGDAVVRQDGTGYLLATLAKLDDHHSYQLWGLGDRKTPVSLGVLGNRLEVASFKATTAVTKLAVTVEEAAGAVAPTTEPILVGELVAKA